MLQISGWIGVVLNLILGRLLYILCTTVADVPWICRGIFDGPVTVRPEVPIFLGGIMGICIGDPEGGMCTFPVGIFLRTLSLSILTVP